MSFRAVLLASVSLGLGVLDLSESHRRFLILLMFRLCEGNISLLAGWPSAVSCTVDLLAPLIHMCGFLVCMLLALLMVASR